MFARCASDDVDVSRHDRVSDSPLGRSHRHRPHHLAATMALLFEGMGGGAGADGMFPKVPLRCHAMSRDVTRYDAMSRGVMSVAARHGSVFPGEGAFNGVDETTRM